MRTPGYSSQFARDVQRMLKRGKDGEKLKTVMTTLVEDERLPERYRDHALIGNDRGRRECHIEPDWLLIYKLVEQGAFARTGTHSDLFT